MQEQEACAIVDVPDDVGGAQDSAIFLAIARWTSVAWLAPAAPVSGLTRQMEKKSR